LGKRDQPGAGHYQSGNQRRRVLAKAGGSIEEEPELNLDRFK
jgi:hypothetical protein